MAISTVRRRVNVPSFLKYPGLCALLIAGAALLGACHPAAITDPNDPKFIVAQKGSWTITKGELDQEVGNYLKMHDATAAEVGNSKMPILQTAMLRNIVLKKLMLEKASAMPIKDDDVNKAINAQIDQVKGASGDAEFQAQLKTAGMTLDDVKKKLREKILIEKVLDAEAFQNKTDPTDAEINDVYLKHKDDFNIPEKVRASRVLVLVDEKTSPTDKTAKKKKIDAARARVAKGEDFSKVAMDSSEDKYSAPRGGDINYFQRGENEPGFDDVAFNTKVNAVSPVFQTQLGYQFVKVTAIQPAGVVPVSQARDYISSKLKEMKMAKEEQDYATKLLANSGVTYNITLVDPPAQVSADAGANGGQGQALAPAQSAPPADQSQQAPPSAAPVQAAPAQAPAAPAMTTAAPATNAAPGK